MHEQGGQGRAGEEQACMAGQQAAAACKHAVLQSATGPWRTSLLGDGTRKHTVPLGKGAEGSRKLTARALRDTYVQEPPVAEDAEQRVHVALAGEVEPCADVATWRQNSSGVPETKPARCCSYLPTTAVTLQHFCRFSRTG